MRKKANQTSARVWVPIEKGRRKDANCGIYGAAPFRLWDGTFGFTVAMSSYCEIADVYETVWYVLWSVSEARALSYAGECVRA